tara:strand:+ start:212 stop:385 length:174 start_codon:yes stop_codon:yes gene_type:complete
MTFYRVFAEETNLVIYYVDADSPEEAKQIYWETPEYHVDQYGMEIGKSEVIEVEEQT